MDRRDALHEILCGILGSRNCYFQPPETVKISYPCIVYERSSIDYKNAGNKKYKGKVKYDLKLISTQPNNTTIIKLLDLQYCSYDRHYVSNNLNHDAFTLFY